MIPTYPPIPKERYTETDNVNMFGVNVIVTYAIDPDMTELEYQLYEDLNKYLENIFE